MGNRFKVAIQEFAADIVVTREQVKDLIKTEGLKPSDLFDMDALGSDPSVKGIAEDRVRERVAGVWREKKEAEEKLAQLQGDLKKEKDDLVKQLNDLKLNAAKAQVGALLDKQKTDRKLDDRQMKFIQNRLAKFSPQKPEDIDKEFGTFLDSEIDEYNRIAKDVFGIEQQDDGSKTKKVGGAEPDESKKGGKAPDKMLDPAQNPMIKIA